jgi:hypothetical protein
MNLLRCQFETMVCHDGAHDEAEVEMTVVLPWHAPGLP